MTPPIPSGATVRVIATPLARQAGFTNEIPKTGAVALIQRFGSALNLHIHLHIHLYRLFLDGVYLDRSDGSRFLRAKAPTNQMLTQLADTIARRARRRFRLDGSQG